MRLGIANQRLTSLFAAVHPCSAVTADLVQGLPGSAGKKTPKIAPERTHGGAGIRIMVCPARLQIPCHVLPAPARPMPMRVVLLDGPGGRARGSLPRRHARGQWARPPRPGRHGERKTHLACFPIHDAKERMLHARGCAQRPGDGIAMHKYFFVVHQGACVDACTPVVRAWKRCVLHAALFVHEKNAGFHATIACVVHRCSIAHDEKPRVHAHVCFEVHSICIVHAGDWRVVRKAFSVREISRGLHEKNRGVHARNACVHDRPCGLQVFFLHAHAFLFRMRLFRHRQGPCRPSEVARSACEQECVFFGSFARQVPQAGLSLQRLWLATPACLRGSRTDRAR